MRYSNFWLFLEHLSTEQYHVELIGDTAFLFRLFQEIAKEGPVALALHSAESVMDDPYLWSQNTLFDGNVQQTSPIVIYGKINTKDQKQILQRLPKHRSSIMLSEKKAIASFDTCYYRPPTLQQWLQWSQVLTGTQPDTHFFEEVLHNPWALFEQWQQLRLLGEISLGTSPVGLSPDGWKKFAELRLSGHKLGLLLQPQDWHQILYCCEMIHQRALNASSEGFYIPPQAVSFKLFENTAQRALVSQYLLEPYQKMLQASLKHDQESFIFHLSRFFSLEELILQGRITHENEPSSVRRQGETLAAQ